MSLEDIPIGDEAPKVVRAVVEIPRGSKNKYEYNAELGVFHLDRVLHSAVHYPASYGFIPQTIGADGDAVDVLVMLDEELSVGILLDVCPIGMLTMEDKKELDYKVLSVAVNDPRYSEFKDIKDVPQHLLVEIEHFFETYKQLEGKHVKTFGWKEAKAARKIIRKGMKEYQTKHASCKS